jgi:hypothetical protein
MRQISNIRAATIRDVRGRIAGKYITAYRSDLLEVSDGWWNLFAQVA